MLTRMNIIVDTKLVVGGVIKGLLLVPEGAVQCTWLHLNYPTWEITVAFWVCIN